MPRDLLAERPEKTAGELSPPALKLNTKRGANPLLRALASIKTTPEGKVSALEAMGQEVITDPSGAIFLVDREAGQMYPLDEKGFTAGDITDVAGEAIEAAPTLTGPGKVVSQAARGVAGSGLRQAVSEALPGKDYPSIFDKGGLGGRALQLLEGGAFGGGGQALAHGGGAALRAIFNPSRFVTQRLQNLEARPEALRGAQLERQTGVPLTPGQRTQSKSLLTIEGMLRRHPGTADIVESREAHQLNQALSAFDRNLDTLTKRDVSPEGIGNAVRHGFGRVVDKAVDIRSKQGRADFGRVEILLAQLPPATPVEREVAARTASQALERAGMEAGRRTFQSLRNPSPSRNIIPTEESLNEVNRLISEFSIPGATPEVIRGVVKELNAVKGVLSGAEGNAIPPRTAQQLLQLWGSAAQGTGRIFKDIDKAQERMIASRVFGALQRDLDAAAEVADESLSPEVAQALKAARDNWRENSAAINELKDSALSRFVGADTLASKDPEAIAQSLLRAKPSALRGSIEILNRADPELAQQVKKFAFEDALEKAGRPLSKTRPQIRAGEAFSSRKLVTALEKSPVWDVLTPVERNRLKVNAELFGRIARTEGEGSPTAPLMFAWDLTRALGGQIGRLDIASAGATLSGVVSARKVADVMFDQRASNALRVMFSPKASNPRKTRAALTFAGLLASSEAQGGEDVRPDTEGLLPTTGPSRVPRDLLEGQGTPLQ